MTGRRPVRRAALATAPALILAALAPSAVAAPVTLPGWPDLTAVVSGPRLVWGTTTVNRPTGFRYWSADVSYVRLGRSGPVGSVETPVSVRTQAGAIGPLALAAGGDGSFVLVARGTAFPPPVIWCCDSRGLETVIQSDGRPGAPVAAAAGVDGRRVRMLVPTATAATLVGEDPRRLSDSVADLVQALPRVEAPVAGRPAGDLAAVDGSLVAWVDRADPTVVRTGTVTDTGFTEGPPVRAGAPVRHLWASAPATLVVAAGRGAVTLARHDLSSGARRVLWRGSGVPRVGVGGGAVAIADGRVVSVARPAGLAQVRATAGAVAAVATDGRRLAVFERITGRGGKRSTALRLEALRG